MVYEFTNYIIRSYWLIRSIRRFDLLSQIASQIVD